MHIQPNSRLLFIGDSITDCGRNRPVGEGALSPALGEGYVGLVDAALQSAYPDHQIHCLNLGVAGDTLRDIAARWQQDVLALQPDWLSVMIGINDVWMHFSDPWDASWLIPLEEYQQTLDDLISRAKPFLMGLVVMTPYLLERERQDPMRLLMDQFGEAAKTVGRKHNAILVDTQAAFDAALSHTPPSRLAYDRIHVGQAGHMILAGAFLDSIAYRR